jgi:hypothetical protein
LGFIELRIGPAINGGFGQTNDETIPRVIGSIGMLFGVVFGLAHISGKYIRSLLWLLLILRMK